MSKRSIHIGRLEIRLKGISPQSARAAVSGLGQELLDRLAAPQNPSGSEKAIKIGRIDTGTLRLPGETAPAELRGVIARRVAASIDETRLK